MLKGIILAWGQWRSLEFETFSSSRLRIARFARLLRKRQQKGIRLRRYSVDGVRGISAAQRPGLIPG